MKTQSQSSQALFGSAIAPAWKNGHRLLGLPLRGYNGATRRNRVVTEADRVLADLKRFGHLRESGKTMREAYDIVRAGRAMKTRENPQGFPSLMEVRVLINRHQDELRKTASH